MSEGTPSSVVVGVGWGTVRRRGDQKDRPDKEVRRQRVRSGKVDPHNPYDKRVARASGTEKRSVPGRRRGVTRKFGSYSRRRMGVVSKDQTRLDSNGPESVKTRTDPWTTCLMGSR